MAAVLQALRNLANDHERVVPIPVFVAVLFLCLVIDHLLEENHLVDESIAAVIMVGQDFRHLLNGNGFTAKQKKSQCSMRSCSFLSLLAFYWIFIRRSTKD